MKELSMIRIPMRRGFALVTMLALIAMANGEEKKDEKAAEPPKPAPKSIFPDKNLENAVRQQVFSKRDTQDPITADDVKNISTVRGKGMGIKDLTGLEHCQALMSIDLSENEIVSLAPLKGLSRLQQIIVNHNKIQDLSPLAGIVAIQYLGIEGNQVKSLEPLKNLERLSSLYADDNQIADLTPITKLPKLGSIHLKNNRLTKLDGISNVGREGNIWSLGVSGNQIIDLSPIKGLKPQSFLFLDGNQIADLGPLIEMMKADLNGEKRFAPYVQVYLKGNPLNDAGKKQLEELKSLKVRVRDR
ncbi:MAG: leucine-rich repeat domain-containing protein [Verrucomicrobiae bacterium]|nr:leucine-rich repeat domain-containing protein [Verrucomicrobiae bacterium]